MPDQEFKLKASRQYWVGMSLAVFASVAIVLLLPLLWWVKILLAIAVWLYGAHAIWKFVLLRDKSSITAIRYQSKQWFVRLRGEFIPAQLLGTSTVTPTIVILRFRIPSKTFAQSAIVFRDSLGEELFRKLLIAVKTGQ